MRGAHQARARALLTDGTGLPSHTCQTQNKHWNCISVNNKTIETSLNVNWSLQVQSGHVPNAIQEENDTCLTRWQPCLQSAKFEAPDWTGQSSGKFITFQTTMLMINRHGQEKNLDEKNIMYTAAKEREKSNMVSVWWMMALCLGCSNSSKENALPSRTASTIDRLMVSPIRRPLPRIDLYRGLTQLGTIIIITMRRAADYRIRCCCCCSA